MIQALRPSRLAAVAVCAILVLAFAPFDARADFPSSPPTWRSTRTAASQFVEASKHTDPAFGGANALSTTGEYFTFLNIDGAIGSGKIYRNRSTEAFSTSQAVYGDPTATPELTLDPGFGFGIRGEISDNGVIAYTVLQFNHLNLTSTRGLDVARAANGGSSYVYPIEGGTLDDVSMCISSDGRYVWWIQGFGREDVNGNPIGGRLYRMDGNGASNDPFFHPQRRPSTSVVTAGVTMATCDATSNKHAYAQVEGTTQKLWVDAAIGGTAATQVALPAPFNATSPYPDHLELAPIDMSPDGTYLAFSVRDTSGALDLGQTNYFVRNLTTNVTTGLPAAPLGQPRYEINSVGNNGTVGVTQRNAAVALAPKVIKLNGEVVPVGAVEDRTVIDSRSYALIAGNGTSAVYPTSSPVTAADTNGVDDFAHVNILTGGASGTLPTANGGPDKTANEGATVTIDASASSSNDAGQPLLSYSFDRGNDGSVEQTGASASYAFTAGDGPGSTSIAVRVADADGTSPADLVAVTFNNVAPTVGTTVVTPGTGVAGSTSFQYLATAADPGDTLTYRWDWEGDGTYDLTGASNPTHVFNAAGTYTGKVEISDGDGGVVTRNLNAVTVTTGGSSNLPTANAGANQSVNEGTNVTMNGGGSSANDAGQSISAYSWDRGLNGVDQTGPLATYQFAAGDGPATVQVGLTVTDPDGTSPQDTASVTVANVNPTITSATVAPTNGTVGVTPFSYSVTASDPADPLTYRWDFDGNGTWDFTGQSPAARTFAAVGTYTGKVEVNDGDGGIVTQNLAAVTITGAATHLPTANAGADRTVNEGAAVSLSASGSSSNDTGQSLTGYAWDRGCDATVEGTSSTYAFTAPDGPATVNVCLKVTDADGTSPSDQAVITVNNAVPTISAATASPGVGTAGVTNFSYAVTASDPAGAGDPLAYRWDFDGNGTWDFTGASPAPRTFPTPGVFTGKVEANDGDGGVVTRNLNAITVNSSGGGGEPLGDDDGDGVLNAFDGAPTTPGGFSRLDSACGNASAAGVRGPVARLGGCLSSIDFFGTKILTGSLYLADGSVTADAFWLFSSRAIRTAPNAALYQGSAFAGFDFTYGFKINAYTIAIFDNGPSGDTLALRVRGPGVDYLNVGPFTAGDFTVR